MFLIKIVTANNGRGELKAISPSCYTERVYWKRRRRFFQCVYIVIPACTRSLARRPASSTHLIALCWWAALLRMLPAKPTAANHHIYLNQRVLIPRHKNISPSALWIKAAKDVYSARVWMDFLFMLCSAGAFPPSGNMFHLANAAANFERGRSCLYNSDRRQAKSSTVLGNSLFIH